MPRGAGADVGCDATGAAGTGTGAGTMERPPGATDEPLDAPEHATDAAVRGAGAAVDRGPGDARTPARFPSDEFSTEAGPVWHPARSNLAKTLLDMKMPLPLHAGEGLLIAFYTAGLRLGRGPRAVRRGGGAIAGACAIRRDLTGLRPLRSRLLGRGLRA